MDQDETAVCPIGTIRRSGKILRDNGPTSDEEMAALLAAKRKKGLIKSTISTSARGIGKGRERLEKLLTEKDGRKAVRLTDRESTKKGGLSDYGRAFLGKVLAFLETSGNQ